MFGQNPKRPPELSDGTHLKIVEIFSTLQGEGPFVGHPSVFVRLGGCNLACEFCDTEFEAFTEMALANITARILELAAPTARTSPAFLRDLVVITGGEPLRQNIVPLCTALLAHGLRVQIETNGTLWQELPAGVHSICSPKISGGRYHPLRPDLLARVDALKFIVTATPGDYHTIGEVGQSSAGRSIPIYVQPMDEGDAARNRANTAHALALAQQHGYRLSLQTHKLLGIA